MMNSLTFHEKKQHGTTDFPVEYYYIDSSHPRYNMPLHWHKEWEIIHIIEGFFTVHADDAVYTARQGDTLLIRDGMLHGGTPQDCVYECLLFDLHRLFYSLDMVKKYLRPIYHQNILPEIYYPAAEFPEIASVISGLFDAYRMPPSENPTAVSLRNPLELIIFGHISQLFSIIFKKNYYSVSSAELPLNTHKIDLLKTVLEYIEQHYASPLSLSELSAVANMNPKYFCRFFRSITHQTPMDYVNMYRIEKAAAMLHSTRLPITDICMECGFNDSSNFIKVFRKYKNMTPKQYRRLF